MRGSCLFFLAVVLGGCATVEGRVPAPLGELGAIDASLLELDWFQGLLVRAGVPAEALPGDGGLTPAQARALLGWLVSSPVEVPLRDFGPWRMAGSLLLECLREGRPLSGVELHERMRRYRGLLVLRPDGILAWVTTGQPVQAVGEVRLWQGALRAGGLTVGPFYAVRSGYLLYPVDGSLTPQLDAPPAGTFEPQEERLRGAIEGAGHAVVDTMEGLVAAATRPIDTVAGLAQLPGAVRMLIQGSPAYWARFRELPPGAQVHAVSRVLTHVLLVAGTTGAGATAAAGAGGLRLPVLALSGEGALAFEMVAVPAGAAVTQVGAGLGAVFVLHMASAGASAPWSPPQEGPGRWEARGEAMSEQAKRYQRQVSGAPDGWVYTVERDGVKVHFDGFKDGVLLEAKGPGYEPFFEESLSPKEFFQGAKPITDQARRQLRAAGNFRVQWHVAEKRVADALRKLLQGDVTRRIEVIHTPLSP